MLGGGPKKQQQADIPKTRGGKILNLSKEISAPVNPVIKTWMEKLVHSTPNPPSDRTSLNQGDISEAESIGSFSVKSMLIIIWDHIGLLRIQITKDL